MEKKEQDINKAMLYEDEILSLIDNAHDMTRSDLQGCVGALVLKIINNEKVAQ